jgi:hypothetical protein
MIFNGFVNIFLSEVLTIQRYIKGKNYKQVLSLEEMIENPARVFVLLSLLSI